MSKYVFYQGTYMTKQSYTHERKKDLERYIIDLGDDIKFHESEIEKSKKYIEKFQKELLKLE